MISIEINFIVVESVKLVGDFFEVQPEITLKRQYSAAVLWILELEGHKETKDAIFFGIHTKITSYYLGRKLKNYLVSVPKIKLKL